MLSHAHLSYLDLFTPGARGLTLPHSIAKTLEIKGLVEISDANPGTLCWDITPKGRKARADAHSKPVQS